MLSSAFLLLIPSLFYNTHSQCCLQFKQDKCIECPPKMHLYQDNCLFDIQNCIKYIDGFDCSLCAYGYNFNQALGTCQEYSYLDVLLHHLTALKPEVTTYTYSTLQKLKINDMQSTVRLHFLDSKKSDIWFEFHVNINTLIFSLEKQSEYYLSQSDMHEVDVDQILKDINFLFALAKIESRQPELANKTIIQTYRSIKISDNMQYRVTFSIGGNLKQTVNVTLGTEDFKKVVEEDIGDKVAPVPMRENIEDLISPEAKKGEEVSKNGEAIVSAEQKARQTFSELSTAKIVRVFKNEQIPNLIDYYLYFEANAKYFQVIIKHQPFFNRFYAFAFNQLN